MTKSIITIASDSSEVKFINTHFDSLPKVKKLSRYTAFQFKVNNDTLDMRQDDERLYLTWQDDNGDNVVIFYGVENNSFRLLTGDKFLNVFIKKN